VEAGSGGKITEGLTHAMHGFYYLIYERCGTRLYAEQNADQRKLCRPFGRQCLSLLLSSNLKSGARFGQSLS